MTIHNQNDYSEEHDDLCADLQPRIAAFALGEMTDDAVLREHLAVCPRCQHELHTYAQLAHLLAYTAPPVEPPSALRARIIASVAAAPEPAVQQRRRRGWQLPAWGAALALLIALVAWNVSLQHQNGAQSAQLANSRASWTTMVALLNAPDVQSYLIDDATVTARFWSSPQQQIGCLVAENLPPLEPTQVYQVWLTNGDERISGGTFAAHDGSAWILLRPDAPITRYQTVGITIEPGGGSPAPTGPQVLFGSIADS